MAIRRTKTITLLSSALRSAGNHASSSFNAEEYKGRKSKDVDDALSGDSAGAIRQGLCTLHKLSLAQFQAAGLG